MAAPTDRDTLLRSSKHVPKLSQSSISSDTTIQEGDYGSPSATAYIPVDHQPEPTGIKWVHGWPTQPSPLTKSGSEFWIRIASDTFAILGTLPFLILAVFAWSKHGDVVVQAEWERIQSMTKVAVTAFPIIFAAVMGRMTRSVATWRLERGAQLGQLEQLLWSSTVFNAVSTQFLLKSFNLLAVGLLLLWALSPLGGQASLHIIDTVARPEVSEVNVTTFNTEQRSFFEMGGDVISHIQTLNNVYVTSLMAPGSTKTSPMDLWGNVKVPIMSRLNVSSTTESGWMNITDVAEEDIPYAALVGVPVFSHSATANTTFSMESSYFDINCDNLTLSSYIPLEDTLNNTINRDPPHLVRVLRNDTSLTPSFLGGNGSATCALYRCQTSFSLGFSHFVKNWAFSEPNMYPNVTGNDKTSLPETPRLLFESRYWARSGEGNPSTVAYCDIKRIYVEARVSCIGDPAQLRPPRCAVTAMRDSLRTHPASDITPFMFGGMFLSFSSRIAQSSGQGRPATATITERYLNNSANPLLTHDVDLPLFRLPRALFSQRLTQILNTYYLTSLLPEGIVGNLSAVISSPQFMQYNPVVTHSVPATVTSTTTRVYAVNPAWLIAFLGPSLALFAAAATSAFFAHHTSIPDVLGYASSLSRDSPFVVLPDGGTALGGLSRAKLLKSRRVRFGDVRAAEDVGYLAFADLKTEAGVERARTKGRVYW
ncbi:hypothetical protein AJ80_00623 [Polytolypa hystricis UAMH7299]|uniref:Uncharacterized protein n=1 Tax=Polytolypa hystricis (strain UAMH7299) TaxID=1447883 RepID=A0A2B7Z2H2_POLH7|nr:hypothetical protein AJ80_00623 [Polytolypa hystricis UAMH7299]